MRGPREMRNVDPGAFGGEVGGCRIGAYGRRDGGHENRAADGGQYEQQNSDERVYARPHEAPGIDEAPSWGLDRFETYQ
ncbi:hypothetical protein GCM10010275_41640 [Streptomyces litmocidini]|nr:hypothetical protein GCM10010275_41640 [Streptomyces litmocidini]